MKVVIATVSIVAILLISASLLLAMKKAQRADEHDEATSRILTSVLEQRSVALEYARARNPRHALGWNALHGEISRLSSGLVPANGHEVAVMEQLRQAHAQAGRLFSALLASGQAISPATAEEMLRGLDDASRRQVDAAQQLRELSTAESRTAHDVLVAGTVAALLILGMLAFGIIAFATVRIVRPLRKVSEGAAIIGGGNLRHRIGIDSADEVGELARAFDLMAARVQQLVAELQAKNAELTDLNAQLESFSHAVAHDLRAPLQAIDIFSQQVVKLDGERLSAEGLRYLNKVRSGVARADRLIGALLELAQAGRVPLRRERVEMQTLVRECLDTLDHEVANRVLDVQIGELPQCPGDPPMLRQMWMNLLGNAVKYTRDRSPAVISVRGEMRDRWCVYEVEDNGAGFDMTYAGKLFQPFQRLHSEAEFPGTGIGLALVHRIVHRHGGSISASSGPAGGALFRVTLPAC